MTPDGWTQARLGDLADVAIGGTPSRSAPELWDPQRREGYRWVAISDLKGRIVADTAEYISALGVQRSNVKRVPAGTPIMSFKLSIGRIALAGCDLYTNEAIAAFHRKGPVESAYLLYALPRATEEHGEADVAVKGKTLNKAKLIELPLLLPPLGEQRKIAAILSSVDDAIEATQAVIDQLHVVKKAMMAELLTRGLPGRHTRFKTTEIGEVPEDWLVVRLEEVLARGPDNGLYKPQGEYGSGVGIVRIDAFGNGDVLERPELRLVRVTDDELQRFALAPSEILINRVNSLSHLAKTALVSALHGPTVFESNIMRMAVDPSQAAPSFVFRVLSSERAREYFLSRAKQAVAQASVNQQDVRAFPIPLPKLEEQVRIANSIDLIDARRRSNLACLSSLSSLKSALMSVLLTGNVRVKPEDGAA